MSKRKNRERYLREGPFKQPGGATPPTRFACPFPDCGAPFTKEEGKLDACSYHRKLVKDVAFINLHIKIVPKNPPPGATLLVPKPGMGDQAVRQEAALAAVKDKIGQHAKEPPPSGLVGKDGKPL